MRIAIAVVIFLIVAVVAGGTVWWTVFVAGDGGRDIEPGQVVEVEIPVGAGTADIAEILVDKGVVENAGVFRLQARLAGVDGEFKAGVYTLQTGMAYEAVFEILTSGPPPPDFVTVTIPEGWTIDQIAERLEAQASIPATEFVQLAGPGMTAFDRAYLSEVTTPTLEGYLFPKTYDIVEGSTATDVINMMLDQFEKETAEIDLSYAASKNLTLNDVVIIASMIEREAQLDAERPLVSSVIYNRLKKGMLLEIDATIEYFLPGNRTRLLYSHLRIDNPYNTYMYKGLPPGPISNPGLASLKAAAAPAETDYIYYVLTDLNGTHTFTDNYSDFLKAKEKSKEIMP